VTFRRNPALHCILVIAVLAMLAIMQRAIAGSDTEKRVALVIGIGAYQNAPALANPVSDARAIGESLRRLNFDVVELYDAGYRGLAGGIRDFGIMAASADVAVIYYAGHGVQIERENYLLPGDVRLERPRDLLYEALPLDRLMGEVAQARKIGLVLLDSCRNNPFTEKVARSMLMAGRAVATTPGMARIDSVPRNTMVVMATKADQIAEDGVGHSPFAAALLEHFQAPGLELSLFFRSVRDTVLRITNSRQEPYVFSSLGADPFYFYPRPPNRPPVIGVMTGLELADVAGPTPLGMPQPTDPDQDPLTVRIIGLPRAGEVRVEGRLSAVNSVYAADRFIAGATYKPDGKSVGPVGTIDLLVEDGRGASITASLPITILPSRRPPTVEARRTARVIPVALSITAPVSPDGERVSVIIEALPRGTVYAGTKVVRSGDRLQPQDLTALTYQPEPGMAGAAGTLHYIAEDGRGGTTEGSLDIEIMPMMSVSGITSLHNTIWEALRTGGDPAAMDAFRKLFPAPPRNERPLATIVPSPTQPAVSEAMRQPPPPVAVPPVGDSRVVAALTPAMPRIFSPPAAVSPPSPLQSHPPVTPISDERFQDCPTCPWMIRVPSGAFTMGQGASTSETGPARRVTIAAFALGEMPITVAEWRLCLAANACNGMPRMRAAGDRTPVHNLSWDDAVQYAAWLSRVTGRTYRLPSEAEWEWAARGGSATRYWWGDAPGIALADCADCGGQQSTSTPMPVDALRPNPFGLYAMLGGVAQWTADCWFPNYHGAPTDGSPRDARSCSKRTLRGGSFRETHDRITVTARANYDASVRYIAHGFRIARNID